MMLAWKKQMMIREMMILKMKMQKTLWTQNKKVTMNKQVKKKQMIMMMLKMKRQR